MRFASPSPPPTSLSFALPSAAPSARSRQQQQQQRQPKRKKQAAPVRPSGRYGLDTSVKRSWDAESSSSSSSGLSDVGDSGLSSGEEEDTLRAEDSSDDDGRDVSILARLDKGKQRSRPERADLLRDVGFIDEIETYDSRSRSLAWRKSQRSSLAHSTHLAALLSPSAARSPATSPAVDDGLAEVRKLLEGLRVERAEEERRERGEFERRNKKLWDDIEATIQTSEEAHVRAAQLKQQEADRQAATARKAAEAEEAARKAKADEAAQVEARAKEKAEQDAARAKASAEEKAAAAKRREGGGGLEVKAEEFGRWVDSMKNIKTNVLPQVNNSAEWKKKCNAVKRQVTPKIGQITNDGKEILRITSELSLILHSALAASTEIYTWILNHLSKILIKQAEAEITANPSAAWPLARLVVGLMLMGHGEGLGNVLMSRFVKKCCWVVPFSPAKQPDQTDAEHRKLTGHLANTQESMLEYTNRLAGILTLYTSILCVLPSPLLLPPPPPGHPPYPAFSHTLIPPQFRLSAGWSWLASILRAPLAHFEPTPTLIAAFLDVAAPRLLDLYGQQAKKALMAIGKDVMGPSPTLGGGKNKPGVARLALALEKWQKGGFAAWEEMEGAEVLR